MKLLLPLLLLTLVPLKGLAQYSTSDAGMWNTFSVKYNFAKKTYLAIDQELRIRDNYNRLNLFYTNIGIGQKFGKALKVELTYRSIQKYLDDNTFSYRHRLMTDFILKKKFGTIVSVSRLRHQIEVKDFYTSRDGRYPEQYFRFKTEIKYDNGSRLTPYVNTEIRYQISLPRGNGPYENNSIHRIRYSAGFDYAFSETFSAGIYYLIQNEFNVVLPENIYITGFQVSKEF